jgi:hypothetical protein
MLTLNSFPSFFSFSVGKEALQCASRSLVGEINENSEERPCRSIGFFSAFSCNSFFSLFVRTKDHAGLIVQNHAFGSQFLACFSPPHSGTISESQHTRCAHRALRALAGGAAPSTPKKQRGQSHAIGKS